MALSSHTFPLISTGPNRFNAVAVLSGDFGRGRRISGFSWGGRWIKPRVSIVQGRKLTWRLENRIHTAVVVRGHLKQWTGGNIGLRPFPKAEQHFQQRKHHQTGLQLMQPKFEAGWTVPSQCCIKSGPSQVSPLPGCCKIERCTQFEDFVEILRMRRILLILKFVKRHLKMNLMRKCCSNYGCFYKC